MSRLKNSFCQNAAARLARSLCVAQTMRLGNQMAATSALGPTAVSIQSRWERTLPSTLAAACELIEKAGGEVICCAVLVELLFLKGRDKLRPHEVYSILQY